MKLYNDKQSRMQEFGDALIATYPQKLLDDEEVDPETAVETIILEFENCYRIRVFEPEIAIIKDNCLSILYSYKMKPKWDLVDNPKVYSDRLWENIFTFYCLLGLDTEDAISDEMIINNFLRIKDPTEKDIKSLSERINNMFFKVYKTIMKYVEYIPEGLIPVISDVVFKYKVYYPGCAKRPLYIEPLLFMYGVLWDLHLMLDDEGVQDYLSTTEKNLILAAS